MKPFLPLPKRYRPLRVLGEGGMGSVFLVEDSREERELALKVCRLPAGAEEWTDHGSALERFRREFLTLSRLSHPCLPRVHDFGWIPGRGSKPPSWFFTYDPVRGEDIHAWSLERSPRELLGVARQLIETLSFLHSRGLLHLDVKPSNIIVEETAGGPRAKLIDFGIVRDGKQIDGAPCLGSLPYMSPELLRGEPVGPAADLFSLGVTLYECFFRARPYAAKSPEDLRRQHEQLPPIPRHSLAAGSGKLLGLVWRLLSRDPVRRLLDSSGGSSAVNGAFSAYLLSNRPVGMQDTLETLFAAYDAVSRRLKSPTLFMIEGEAGSGKTRVLSELEDMVQVAGGRFLWISPRGAGFRGNPWTAALADALIEVVGSKTRAARSLREVTSPLEDPLQGEDEYARARKDQARARYFETVFSLLSLAARARPLVLAFDDVHACDPEALSLIQYLARNVHLLHLDGPGEKTDPRPRTIVPALLCVSYRPEEARQPLADGEPYARRLRLLPLTVEQVGGLLAGLFGGRTMQRQLVRAFHTSSRGNPFVLVETMKSLLEEGAIVYRPAEGLEVRDPPETWRLPGTVDDLLTKRWNRLDLHERRLAACLSACPGDIQPADAVELSPFHAASTARALEGLTLRLVLSRHEDARDGSLIFAHPRLKDLARKALSRSAARRVHRKLALLRQRAGAPAHELAMLFTAAGDVENAARHAESAAAGPGETLASSLLGEMYEGVLSMLPRKDSRRLALAVKLAEIHSTAGDHAKASELLEGALRGAPRTAGARVPGRCLLALANERVLLRDLERARSDYEKAERLLRKEPEAWQDVIRARLGLSRVESETGNPAAAMAMAHECIQLLDDGPGRGEECDRLRSLVLSRIGSLHAARSRYDAAIDAYTTSEKLLRRQPYSIEKGGLCCNLANLHRACGRLDEALGYYRRAHAVAVRIRARDLQALVLANLGVLHLDRWDLSGAAAAIRASLQLAESTGTRRYVTFARLCRGAMLARRADLDEAIEILEGELGRSRMEKNTHFACSASFLLVKPYVDRGRMDRASEVARTGRALAIGIRRPRSVLEGDLALGVAQYFLGQFSQALRSLERARKAPTEHHPQIDAEILLYLGLIRLETGRVREAERDLRQAVKIFLGLKIALRACEAKNHLSLALAALGHRSEARRLSDQAWQALARIRRDERPPVVWTEILLGRSQLSISGVLESREEMHDLLHDLCEIREVLGEKKVERLKWQVSARLAGMQELLGDPEAARLLRDQAREELDRLLDRMPPRIAERLRGLPGARALAGAPGPRRAAAPGAGQGESHAAEAARLRDRLLTLEASHKSILEENRRLRAAGENTSSRVATRHVDGRFHGLVGHSAPMRRMCALLEKVAVTDIPILLRGETGTGKDMAAHVIHETSLRRGGRFVAETLSAIPEGLLESEVFGYAAGAFSGAIGDREGLLVSADGGTLYLADIGELPLEVQAKIVRVLETMEVRPLGASSVRRVAFRLVTSTQYDLGRAVAEGRFRQDLLFRIQGVEIVLPPLRERRDDIPLLVEHFLKLEAGRSQLQVKLEPDAMTRLLEHDWPGNVRELENEIRRLAILGSGKIRAADLAFPSAPGPELGAELLRPGVFEKLPWPKVREALERAYFERALETSGGSLKDLASRLGVHRRTIAKIRKRLGLDGRR